MTDKHSKVLILGSDTRSFLTVIRSLGRAGKEVHVAWCSRSALAATSKYVAKVHNPVRPSASGWKQEFRDLLEREEFDLVIPCNDPSILPLHEEREYFSAYPIYLIDNKIFSTVMDKAAVNQVAAKAGLRLPKEVTIRSLDDLTNLDQLQPPYVLKPTQSYVANSLSKKNHVEFASDLQMARKKLKLMLKRTSVAVQEFFEGVGVGIEFISEDGRILTAFQHVRLHEPLGGGGSSYRKSCPLNPELMDATSALIHAFDYTGVGMAEYRYHSNSRDWIFVELNSRFWGSLPLAVSCGVDFPAYLYDLCCTDRRDFPKRYRENRVCRNWFRDLHWLRDTIATKKWSVPRQLKLAWQLTREIRYPLTFRESCDTITRDDPTPGVNEIKEALVEVPRRIRRKVFGSAMRMGPLRNWSRQRLLRKLASSRQILFVCKGNICRSPFAEQYVVSKLGQQVQVDSCGYFPKTGRPSPENAIVAATEFGIDLSPHRSEVISPEAVNQADAILIFDEENRSTIEAQFPQSRGKTFMLGLLLEEAEFEIVDPYGGSVADFRSIYSRISHSLDFPWPSDSKVNSRGA